MKSNVFIILFMLAVLHKLDAQDVTSQKNGYEEFKKEQSRIKDSIQNVRLTKLYGSKIAKRIMKNEIWLGMTIEQTIESIGEPNKINETVTSRGTDYQFVYEDKYLYFENGLLKSFQRSY